MNGTAGYTKSVLSPETDALITQIIGCAIRVHTELGPGFLETIYASALGVEFEHSDIAFEREKAIVVRYRGQAIAGQRLLALDAEERANKVADAFPEPHRVGRVRRRVAIAYPLGPSPFHAEVCRD